MNINKYKNIIINCLSLFACIMTIMGFSGHIYSPFCYHTTCSKVADIAEYEKGSVILNDYNTGVMFLNKNGNLISYLSDNSILGTDIVNYAKVEGFNNNVWVHECIKQEGSFFVSEERLVRYSYDGKKLDTVFTLKHDVKNPEDCFVEQAIVGMVADENGGSICLLGKDSTLKVMEFNIYAASDGEEIYSLDTEKLKITEPIIWAKYFKEADIIAAADIMGRIYKIIPSENAAEYVGLSNSQNDIFDFSLSAAGDIIPIYEFAADNSRIPFSLRLALKNILFYLCII